MSSDLATGGYIGADALPVLEHPAPYIVTGPRVMASVGGLRFDVAPLREPMTCSCACHSGPGAYPPPCDVPGGCGSLTVCAAAGCTRPADPVLCRADTGRLGDWLARLGAEYAHLSALPSMQGREPGTGGGSGLKSQRAVGDLTIMALRDPRTAADPDTRERSIHAVLVGWAELVRDERKMIPAPQRRMARLPGRHGPLCDHWCRHASCQDATWRYYRPFLPTVASERRLLADQLPWILGQEWAGAFFDEIRHVWGLLMSANGAPSIPRPRRACPVEGCGGVVKVVTGVQGMEAQCGTCRAYWQGLDVARLGAAA